MRQSVLLSFLISVNVATADGILGSLLSQITSLGNSAVEELKQLNQTSPLENPPFDASQQLVDVTGVHRWIAPGPNDQRGPCPGLNALANHGYLPRNGLPTIIDLVSATTEVYNMGLDLAAILSAYGAVLDGDGVGWSIGGQQHTGIGGSRGNYESDSSPTRGDLLQYGSNTDLVKSQFKALLDMQPDPATANYDLSLLGAFREARFHQSVANNPSFYYAPFSGVAVSQAAYTFIYRFMANHTAEHPAGILDQETLMSFFAMSGSSDNLTWNSGYERIPDNWYKRANNDAYGIFQLGSDMGTLFRKYPDFSKPGCNQGTVNSFVVINASDNNPNDYDFSNPTNALCYGLVEAIALVPSLPALGIVIDVVQELLIPIQNALGCTTVPSINSTIAKTCPGYSLWAGPTAPIVKGATQPS